MQHHVVDVYKVSTHASVRRRHYHSITMWMYRGSFNSRLREEATIPGHCRSQARSCFNSRLREEATADFQTLIFIKHEFQLTPP